MLNWVFLILGYRCAGIFCVLGRYRYSLGHKVNVLHDFVLGVPKFEGHWRIPLHSSLFIRRMWMSCLPNYRTYWESSMCRYRHLTTLTTCGLLTQTVLCIERSLTKWKVFNVMQIQKPMMPKYIKGRSFVLFIKRREANTLSTSPLYVSTKTSPAGQTIQGCLWYSTTICKWG